MIESASAAANLERIEDLPAQGGTESCGLSAARVQVAYNQAMASCSWEQAWACFHAMRRAGVQPNTRSYNAVSALSSAPQPRSMSFF